MKKSFWLAILSLVVCCTFNRCVEPFDLPATVTDANFLVVEGHVDIDNGTSQVLLSRTQKLAEKGKPVKEKGAKVTIETSQQETIHLAEVADGLYRIAGLNLTYGNEYRLRIRTANGQEYLSEFVSTNKTPEIDSVTWRVERNEVRLGLNTHDPSNNTRYYRWEFEETYEYNSYYNSIWDYVNGEVVIRKPEQSVYFCWKSNPSTAILVGTTSQLGQDVMRDFPLAYSDGYAEKFARKYSVLVKQYALSKEEYEYWQLLKKNTESVGTVFDAQPSQVRGNIVDVNNADSPVLGYFSARSTTTKRIFISGMELVKQGFSYSKIPECIAYTTTSSTRDIASRVESGWYIVEELLPTGSGYMVANAECADCRTKGGSTKKPEFWDN